MHVAVLVETVAKILAMIGIGFLLRAFRLLKREDAGPLNTVILYAGIPALIFQAVHPAKLSTELLGVTAVAWAVSLFGMAVAWPLGRALKLEGPSLGGFILVSALGNTGFLGYPLALELLGKSGLVRAVFYDVFGTVGVMLTVGLFIAERFGRHDVGVNPFKEILTFPPLVAVVLALALKPVTLPTAVSSGLDMLASLTVPLIMIALGLSLTPGRIKEHVGTIGAAGAVKLVALPLLAWALGTLVFRDTAAVEGVRLSASMPSMTFSLVIALRFGLDDDLVASTIVLTTALSLVTVPLLLLL